MKILSVEPKLFMWIWVNKGKGLSLKPRYTCIRMYVTALKVNQASIPGGFFPKFLNKYSFLLLTLNRIVFHCLNLRPQGMSNHFLWAFSRLLILLTVMFLWRTITQCPDPWIEIHDYESVKHATSVSLQYSTWSLISRSDEQLKMSICIMWEALYFEIFLR